MTEPAVELPDLPGWSVVSAGPLHLVVRAGGSLVDHLRAAAQAHDLDDVLDALARDGLRRAPEFVAVLVGQPSRVVVRGSAVAVLTTPAGQVEVRAAGRGPWTDTDAPPGTTAVTVRSADTAPAPGPDPAPAGEATTPPPAPDQGSGPVGGWPRPALLRRERPAAPSSPAPAVEPTPPPPTSSAAPAGPGGEEGEEVEELPSYDHLFGATQHDRPSYIEQHDTGTIEEPPIGHAPIESAGGFDPRADGGGDHHEHTLAPPTHTVTPPPPPPPAAPPPASPPAPTAPSRPAPGRGGIIDSVPWRSGGSNVPAPDPAPASARPPVQDQPARPQPAPGGVHTPPPAPALRPASPPPPATPPPTPPAGPPTAEPSSDDADATVDRSALLGRLAEAGPQVLAVLCPAGHTSPPHSGTCRQCGREVPPQQPFQTARPPLGVLRLPTGDAVTLDRGVLLGRSPKVNAELDAADRPHLVKVPSPQNDISRNHVEIVLEGWHVLIRDLGSTNGTTVTLPGQPPVRLRPSDQQVLEPGTVITLADEVAITFEVPA